MESVKAVIKNTPLQFKVSQDFANKCIDMTGNVFVHEVLGPLFLEEVQIDNTGSVQKIVCIGTSKKDGLRDLSRLGGYFK